MIVELIIGFPSGHRYNVEIMDVEFSGGKVPDTFIK